MQLTTLGAHAAMFGEREKQLLGNQLINGEQNINTYTNGVCFDAAAYVRYLLSSRISPNELLTLTGQGWKSKFDFMNGIKWNGVSQIPGGTAVGFYRPVDNTIFHAAISAGGTNIRAVNGHRLGSGWVPVNLSHILNDRNQDGTFNYDNTKISVYLSKL